MTSSLLVFLIVSLWAEAALADRAISLTPTRQRLIINLHNQDRAKEPASDMKTMTWDAALAQQAQQWTDKCVMKHQSMKPWGENLAADTYIEGQSKFDDLITAMFYRWTAERTHNKGGTFVECCGPIGVSCCHYDQVIWAATNKVGCGLTFCDELTGNKDVITDALYLACYYQPKGNIVMGKYPHLTMTPYTKA